MGPFPVSPMGYLLRREEWEKTNVQRNGLREEMRSAAGARAHATYEESCKEKGK